MPWSNAIAFVTFGQMSPYPIFAVGACFHYLGPAFAVLLFQHVAPPGVAWLRIATAALVFAIWRRPWRYLARLGGAERRAVVGLGIALGLMNACFYEAIARLPLGTVSAIELLGPIVLAAAGMRTARKLASLSLVVAGVYALTDVRIEGEPLGYVFAFANCGLFMIYIALGHRIAGGAHGIDRLGAAMIIALITVLPIGIRDAAPAFTSPPLLGAAIGVGIASSVIPYVCDQLAMARLPRATFAFLLSLLPAMAFAIGLVVLRQVPTLVDCLGLVLVIAGTWLHSRGKQLP
jgi:inner membrane transporter RhtA